MIDLLLTVFRYIFLIILYVFLFQLIKMIYRDLRSGRQEVAHPAREIANRALEELPPAEVIPLPGAVAGLATINSSDPGISPGSVFPLKSDGELTLGRGSRNKIIMTDPYASSEHAVVYGTDGQYWIKDHGSKNGTYLNDVRINKPTVLADGDKIRIGDVTMQFVRWSYEVESGDRSGPHKEAKRG
ncbi:MAG: FHA domain-containing protein [Bacillota bacterium]